MNRNFSQTITVHCDDPDVIVAMAREWDDLHATGDIVGYMGERVLADREMPGRYVIIADFGVIDPNVSANEEAMRNNDRPETQDFHRRRSQYIIGEPEYHEYDELYRTDFVR